MRPHVQHNEYKCEKPLGIKIENVMLVQYYYALKYQLQSAVWEEEKNLEQKSFKKDRR